MDLALSFGLIYKAYAVVIVTGFALLVVWIFVWSRADTGIGGATLRALIGYNALFMVSIFTIASIGVVLGLSGLQYLGVVRFQIRLAVPLKALAACVGYGSLAGVVGASLSPLAQVLLVNSAERFSGALSPSILVEMPAVGAVAGYVVGLVAMMLGLCRSATNLAY